MFYGLERPMSHETKTDQIGPVETMLFKLELPPEGFLLTSGRHLADVTIAYEVYGERSAASDNCVLVCHALSGDAHAAGVHATPSPEDAGPWWPDMIGPGKGIDTNLYFVICANVIGGCQGSTGPSSVNPATGKPYGAAFPELTVTDMVRAHQLFLQQMGIERLAAVVGGSFGGMQALEWAVQFSDRVDRCICIASAAGLSAQALAFDVVGRKAIRNDPDWQGGDYYESGRIPKKGLALARKVAHITYLSPEMMDKKFGRDRWNEGSLHSGSVEIETAEGQENKPKFQVQTYLEYQGEKFTQRFDANSYLHITRAMDEYDLVANHGLLKNAFKSITSKMTVIALSSDWLFTPDQSRDIANALLEADKEVSYCEMQAPHGHDAFLVDIEPLSQVIRAFLPWVGKGGPASEAASGAAVAAVPTISSRPDFEHICSMVERGARVLDMGAGNGELLSLLSERRGVKGMGIDIELDHVVDVIDRGHDIFQTDINGGLAMIPDGMYDYAVLSKTLHIVKEPRFVLHEMLRVAGQGIISFANLAYWAHRMRLLLAGRMPVVDVEGTKWYDTPAGHMFSLSDICALCDQEGIRILEQISIPADPVGKVLTGLGARNLGAANVLLRISK
jgi:homoserine O-acetyltransferase